MHKLFDARIIPQNELHRLIVGAVAPRPIALASTVDENGTPNLSPFSFFNAFGVNPSTIIFSPARRGRNNTTKDTFENLKRVPEVCINAVSYSMVEQVSLASAEFAKGINEFEKAGFTMLESLEIKPFRVKESPVQWECKVRDIIETGTGGGAANLIICEVLVVHVEERILTASNGIDPMQIDLVGRMGGEYYVRANGSALFQVAKPLNKPVIGIDMLPQHIRNSEILSGNDLGILGSQEYIPSVEQVNSAMLLPGISKLAADDHLSIIDKQRQLHKIIKNLITNQMKQEALNACFIPIFKA
ncbi:MAG TPA: flavin reductase family protein [Lentimicrobium sp.]|nr:flavin reductase family protein [Lentimicrobium sp.]